MALPVLTRNPIPRVEKYLRPLPVAAFPELMHYVCTDCPHGQVTILNPYEKCGSRKLDDSAF